MKRLEAVLKRLRGALTRLGCVLELAKAEIRWDTSLKNIISCYVLQQHILNAFSKRLTKYLSSFEAVLKRLQGALKRLGCVLELAKTLIWGNPCFKNQAFDLHDSKTLFAGVLDTVDNIFETS